MRAIVKTSDSVIEIINTDLEIDLKTENIDLKHRIEKYRKKCRENRTYHYHDCIIFR